MEIIKSEKQLLTELDNMEESIELINMLNEKYDNLKKDIKSAMLKVAKENGIEQVKWVTPKGTQITCSVGHIAETEKRNTEIFDIEKLKKEYPEVYKNCLEEKDINVIIKNATSDRLVITLPKKEEE